MNGFRLARVRHSGNLCFDVWPSIEELKELLKEALHRRFLSFWAKNHTADLETLQLLAGSIIQNNRVCMKCPRFRCVLSPIILMCRTQLHFMSHGSDSFRITLEAFSTTVKSNWRSLHLILLLTVSTCQRHMLACTYACGHCGQVLRQLLVKTVLRTAPHARSGSRQYGLKQLWS